MSTLILFLIRLKLGVKKWEKFRFNNQKSHAVYFIDDVAVWRRSGRYELQLSNMSLNWLLDANCKITKVSE